MNLNRSEAKTVETLLRTTMIGSISKIEDLFGRFWAHGTPPEERTEKQEKLYELFMELREQILDLGNEQIRILRNLNEH